MNDFIFFNKDFCNKFVIIAIYQVFKNKILIYLAYINF